MHLDFLFKYSLLRIGFKTYSNLSEAYVYINSDYTISKHIGVCQ